jgi:hypothetical protein
VPASHQRCRSSTSILTIPQVAPVGVWRYARRAFWKTVAQITQLDRLSTHCRGALFCDVSTGAANRGKPPFIYMHIERRLRPGARRLGAPIAPEPRDPVFSGRVPEVGLPGFYRRANEPLPRAPKSMCTIAIALPPSAACGSALGRAYRPLRRRGRVAEGGGLLNRYRVVKPYRGFESLRLRQIILKSNSFLRFSSADPRTDPGLGNPTLV